MRCERSLSRRRPAVAADGPERRPNGGRPSAARFPMPGPLRPASARQRIAVSLSWAASESSSASFCSASSISSRRSSGASTAVSMLSSGNFPAVSAAFEPPAVPRAIDQDPPHGFRGRREEMPAVVPIPVPTCGDQPQIRLMHQPRGLQRIFRPFKRHPCRGQLSQLLIDQRQQLVRRSCIPLFDAGQDQRDLTGPSAASAAGKLIVDLDLGASAASDRTA